MTRFLNISLVFISILLLSACKVESESMLAEYIPFNDGWQFSLNDSMADAENSIWENVRLPHTPRIEALEMSDQQWQGTCIYRKTFDSPDPSGDKYVALRFGAAMHLAKVYLNGELLTTHSGGYLPFVADLTGKLKAEENTLLVEINNEDNKHIPPGKPIAGLDFNYYGGLYRNVDLVIREKIHITDPVEADKVSGGGIYIVQESITPDLAILTVSVDIANLTANDEDIQLKISVIDPKGNKIFSELSDKERIRSNSSESASKRVEITTPELWSPDLPSLYTLEVLVLNKGAVSDAKKVRTGLRYIDFDADGFYINGQKLRIRGTNRHQEYPYVGYAIGDNADYRDAYKIKKAGFNFVRLSHYPHSESFLDACDELGLLVMDAIPGWQFVGDSLFLENSKKDLRDMIRRDRNHPSIILWEASLNESWMPYDFISEMHRICKSELEGRDAFTCGWMDTIYDVFIPARQHSKPPEYWNTYAKDRPLLIAEYGDWEYYAQNAGFNQEEYEDLLSEERTSRQLRAYGQKRLAQQALNYQEAHNDNLRGAHAGDANWLMYDYNRGYAPDIESSGIMDIFRLPKFAYYFYRSQKNLSTGDTVLFVANYWSDPQYTDIKVYSNCERVELWLNDSLVSSGEPDRDRYSDMLMHPSFTFKGLQYSPGKLEARGLVDGEVVRTAIRQTPGSASKLALKVDYSGKKLSSKEQDLVFVYAMVQDEKGTPVYDSDATISFTLEGDGELIGDNPARAEAGIATIIYRTAENCREAVVTAVSDGMEQSKISLEFNK